MLKRIHERYLDRHRPFRHPFQHLVIAANGYIVTLFLLGGSIEIAGLLVFYLTTFLIDIDGVVYVLLHSDKASENIRQLLKQGKIIFALTEGVRNHKEFSRLYVHNVFGLVAVLVLYSWVIMSGHYYVSLVLGAILTHFLFDIADDLSQLGHLDHWLWPIK